jgi:hypothetical protein
VQVPFTEAQQNTNYRLDTLTDDMAEVKDILFELWYRNRAHAYFAPLIRRTHVLAGKNAAGDQHLTSSTSGAASSRKPQLPPGA